MNKPLDSYASRDSYVIAQRLVDNLYDTSRLKPTGITQSYDWDTIMSWCTSRPSGYSQSKRGWLCDFFTEIMDRPPVASWTTKECLTYRQSCHCSEVDMTGVSSQMSYTNRGVSGGLGGVDTEIITKS